MSLKGNVVVVLGCLAWAGAGLAQAPERVAYVRVTPGMTSVIVNPGDLPAMCGTSGTLSLRAAPRHGQFTTVNKWLYQPRPDFWMLGYDSLDYTVEAEDGVTRYCALAYRLERSVSGLGEWEFDEQVPSWLIYGLGDPTNGGSTSGGGGVKVRVPPPPGPISPGVAEARPEGSVSESWVLSASSSNVQVAAVVADDGTGSYSAHALLTVNGTSVSSDSLSLTPGVRQIDLDWWRQPGEADLHAGGVRLRVDGRSVAPVLGSQPTWYSLFMAGAQAPLEVPEEPVLRVALPVAPAVPLRLRTDFDGALLPWDGAPNSAMRIVSSDEKVRGRELAISWPPHGAVSSSWRAAVPPTDTLNVHMRLRAPYGNTGTVPVFSALEDGSDAELLRLSVENGFYWGARLVATLGDTERYEVSLALAKGKDVTVEWRGPSGKSASDGLLRVWVGSDLMLDVDSVSARGGTVGALRLGPSDQPDGAGTVFVDDVEVWY